MDRDAELVSDQVLAALVPSEAGKSRLISDACCAAVRELALAYRSRSFREGVIERKGPIPVAALLITSSSRACHKLEGTSRHGLCDSPCHKLGVG